MQFGLNFGLSAGDQLSFVFDQTIVWTDATMTSTQFPTVTDIDLSGNTLLAEEDDATATSLKITTGNLNSNAVPTVINTAKVYTIEDGATNTSATVTDVVTSGDIILLNDGASTTLQEFDTTGHVSESIISSTDPFGDSSLIAKYELDGDATDTTGTYDGTLGSGISTGVGKFSQCAESDDSINGKVTFGSGVGDVTEGTAQLAISIWFKISSFTGNDTLLSGSADYQRIGAFMNSSKIGYFASSNGSSWDIAVGDTPQGTTVLETDTWYNWIWMRDATGFKAYINNELDYSLTTGASIYNSSADWRTGVWGVDWSSYTFDGSVDQIEIYDKALSSDERDTLYTQGYTTIDLTDASLTSAPTTIAKNTADISTSLVGTGEGDSFDSRVIVSHTADATSSPTIITDVFNGDTRKGEDYKLKADFAKSGDEITSISTSIDKAE